MTEVEKYYLSNNTCSHLLLADGEGSGAAVDILLVVKPQQNRVWIGTTTNSGGESGGGIADGEGQERFSERVSKERANFALDYNYRGRTLLAMVASAARDYVWFEYNTAETMMV